MKVCVFPLNSTCLVLAGELVVGDVCRQVRVEHGTEGQAVVPAAAEVGDINVLKSTVTIQLHFDFIRQNIYSFKSIETKFLLLIRTKREQPFKPGLECHCVFIMVTMFLLVMEIFKMI